MLQFSRLLFLLVGSTIAFAELSTARATETQAQKPLPSIRDVGTDLGAQVTRAMMMRSDFGPDKDGRLVMYTVLMGNPAVLAVTDVESAKVLRTHPLPGTSGAWSVMTAKDGTVYLGAYNAGLLYRYFPKTDKMKSLGHPFQKSDVVLYPTAEGPDGKIYGGAYSSGHAYEFDPATEKFRDLGDVTTTTAKERWIRVTQYDPATNRVYFGIGNQPQLVEYDLATDKKRNILPPQYADITSVYDLAVAGGRLFCRKETSNPFENFVLDQETGKTIPVLNKDTGETSDTFNNGSRGMSPVSPAAPKLYYISRDYKLCEYDLTDNSIRSLGISCPSVATGYHWAELNTPEWPGWTLLGTTGNSGELFRFNPETNRFDSRKVEYPGQPINIHSIALGPDGKIYSGGYLAGNMGVYDPATKTTKHLNGSGQPEGLVFLGKKLYMGVYPGARIYEYDTEKPWNARSANSAPTTSAPLNPRQVLSLEENPAIAGYTDQDRPFAMAASEDRQEVYVGTIPKNGQLGGVLAVLDPTSTGAASIHWNLLPDQSVATLAYSKGVVYGGTSIYGGLGSTPKAKEAELFAFDPETKKLLYSLVPVAGQPAITQVLARPDGTIWGLAGDTLFVFDPESRKVVYAHAHFPGAVAMWRNGSLVNGADRNVYGIAGGKLFKADGNTREVTFYASGVDKMTISPTGHIYASGSPITVLREFLPPR